VLVYGDHPREVETAEAVAALTRRLGEVEALGPGLDRHAAWVALLIEAGELAQGVCDALFAERQRDERTAITRACEELVLALGRVVVASWRSGFRESGPPVRPALEALARLALPPEVICKAPEGHVFYALYPEAYLEAARAVPREGAPVRVIGLRSIGLGLSGVVAAALGAEAPLSVRPVGHPFQRTLSLSPELEALLVGERDRRYVIVDEGPGLSGSSFGAVADFLEERGVPARRMHFLPSHLGELGPQAQERHRERWRSASRHVVDFEPLLLRPGEPSHALTRWVEDLTGPAESPLEDVGGGGWRRHLLPEEAWPAVHVRQERRKYLLRACGRTWLLRFVGLGRYGERHLERARALAEAGFSPPVVGLRHGFLVQPWLSEARPLQESREVDRRELITRVGAYLGHRARHWGGAPERSGASPRELWEMARYNAAQALGPELAARLEAWEPRLASIARAVRRMETDNRLHAWEWLWLPGGRILKTDGVDHCRGHDLVGCQDLAWDLAGAAVELELTEAEQATLREAVARHGGTLPEPEVLRFHLLCYLAFQLGHHALAASALEGSVPEEAARLRRAAQRYGEALRQRIIEPYSVI
jgi:hypothetical protein